MKTIQRSVFYSFTFTFAMAALLGLASLQSCATLNALAGLSRVQFKLNDVAALRLAGVDISNKRTASDFSVMDGLNLLNAFRSGKFPLTFQLSVAANNPNQPTAARKADLTLQEFPWKLLIDGNETIAGNIGAPVGLPGAGMTTMIPLQVSVDLAQFFGNRGYDDILNLALAIAGQGAAKLQLKAQPTLGTPLGQMRYPGELTIVSTEFRS